jgi:uncharacterized spore protein YtfJ
MDKKKILKTIINLLILFVPAIVFAFLNRIDFLSIFAGISIVAILIINLDSIKTLNAFGVKAEMKEAINEAYATINQLKQMQTINAKIIYNLITKRRQIFNNDTIESTNSIISIYENAKNINNEKKIEVETKRALYSILINSLKELLDKISNVIKQNKYSNPIDNNNWVLGYYYSHGDGKSLALNGTIPTLKAIKDAVNLTDNDCSDVDVKEIADEYQYVISEYSKKFSDLNCVDNLDMEAIKTSVEKNRESNK